MTWGVGVLRLVHLFPSLLTASVTGIVATLAGADAANAGRLGGAMFAMQCSIGAVNDLVDAPLDALEKPQKPLPRGLVTRRSAWVVACSGAALGLGLSAVSGPATVGAAFAVLGLGYAYDLRLSRTALSWLPLALALPVLPAYAWLGATGGLPAGLLLLAPVAVLAGAGLSIANGIVDVDRDGRTGRQAASVQLGRSRAWVLHGLLLGAAAALALVLAPTVQPGGPPERELLRIARTAGFALGLASLVAGGVTLAAGRAGLRERGWELEAMGVAGLGLGWLAAVAAAAGGVGS